MKSLQPGTIQAASGCVPPQSLGRVLMHEHLIAEVFDADRQKPIWEEKPMTQARRALVMDKTVSVLKACVAHGCRGMLDATMQPWRAWPTFYREVSEITGMHIVLSTGFYVDESGNPNYDGKGDPIWPYARDASLEALADLCAREIAEGINNTDIRAGAIKLSTLGVRPTPTEEKTLRAGARAQKLTGVCITTHCGSSAFGSASEQLRLFDREGVDLRRVVIGHAHGFLMNPDERRVCLEWMKRGANFMPTNPYFANIPERRRPLVEAFHDAFNAGLGEHIVLGMDEGLFSSFAGPFALTTRPEPYTYMFTGTLPAFRNLGMTPEEEDMIMVKNPQRILALPETSQ